jgi:hypothetical protein
MKILHSDMNKFINLVLNKEELPQQSLEIWKDPRVDTKILSVYLFKTAVLT